MRPARLQRQSDFLRANRDVVALGSAAVEIDVQSRVTGLMKVPTSDAKLRSRLMRANPFIHSAMLIVREAFEKAGGYRKEFPHVEDYDLWLRLARVDHLANIAEPLVDHRRHETAVSAQNANAQRLNLQLCRIAWQRDAGVIDAGEHARLHTGLSELFTRAVELEDNACAMTGSDLEQFTRMLPMLGSAEARRLARIVESAALCGALTRGAASIFRFRATVTSRVTYAQGCSSALKFLQVEG
jgi:hypothetical protein